MTTHLQRGFWIAAGIAAAAECVVIYQQWPAPPVKICASIELGGLLALAAKADAELHAARILLQRAPNDDTVKDVMRVEAAAAAASNAVAVYKQRAQEQQKASGKGAGPHERGARRGEQ